MILFAMLLMARKTWRTLRVGSAYQWLQWHVWIALVSYRSSDPRRSPVSP